MSHITQEARQILDILTAIITSHNTDTIRQAEILLQQLLDQHVEKVIESLLILMYPPELSGVDMPIHVRSLTVILLTKHLPVGEEDLMSRLPEELQARIKNDLLNCFIHESSPDMLRHLMHCIVSVAQVLLYKDEWPELLPFIFSCASNTSRPDMKLHALTMVSLLTDSCAETLNENIAQVYKMIVDCLADPSLQVLAHTVTCACKVVGELVEPEPRKEFRRLLPKFLEILSACLTANDQSSARNILLAFVELVSEKEELAFFKPHLDAIVQAMSTIASAPQLSDYLRQFSLELVVAIIVGAPDLVNALKPKHKTLLATALAMCCQLMMTLPAESGDWGTTCESSLNDDDDESNYDAAAFALYRIAQVTKPKKLVDHAIPTLTALFSQADWRYRHTAVTALTQFVGVVSLQRMPSKAILGFLSDPHPRVRYAALICIAQCAEEYAPRFQAAFHQIVLPLMPGLIGERALPRLQHSACTAVVSFAEQCEEGVLVPHMSALMQCLMGVLSTAQVEVQKEALSAIAALAGANTTAFMPFYDTVVPPIKQLLLHAQGQAQMQLRCKAIEALTYIGVSVGRDKFHGDAMDLLNFYMSLHSSGQKLSSDDDAEEYMLRALARICSVLGREFAPCLPLVVPPLLETVARMPATKAIKLSDNVDEASLRRPDDDAENPIARLRASTEKVLDAIEDKTIALSMLASFVTELKDLFFPYTRATIRAIAPFMYFPQSEEVQQHVICLYPDLVQAAVAAYTDPTASARCSQEELREILMEVIGYFLPNIARETETNALLSMVSALFICVTCVQEQAAALLDGTVLTAVIDQLMDLVRAAQNRIEARTAQQERLQAQRGGDQGDNEDDDDVGLKQKMLSPTAITRLNINDAYIAEQAVEAIANFARTHGTHFLPIFERLFPELVAAASHQHSRSDMRRLPFILFYYVCQHAGEPLMAVPAALDAMLGLCRERLLTDTGDGVVLERVAYTVGAAVENCGAYLCGPGQNTGAAVLDALVISLQRNMQVLAEKYPEGEGIALPAEEEDDEYVDDIAAEFTGSSTNHPREMLLYALDNITCAIGKFACLLQAPQALTPWLHGLPIRVDQGEGDKTYKLLCQRVDQADQALLADANILGRVIHVLCVAVSDEERDEFVRETLCRSIVKLFSSAPQSSIESAVATLTADERSFVQDVYGKAQSFVHTS